MKSGFESEWGVKKEMLKESARREGCGLEYPSRVDLSSTKAIGGACGVGRGAVLDIAVGAERLLETGNGRGFGQVLHLHDEPRMKR